jgi:IS5 family transposase
MLTLAGGQAETLFDLALPVEVGELPAELATLDRLLDDPALLAPIAAAWDATAIGFGRPSMAMDRLIRLMVVKARSGGWGYQTLVREVSDSLHLRRFCRIALTERVPDESTIRKLVRRLGPEVIEEIVMAVVAGAIRPRTERRFVVRAARVDCTVVESDIRYPTDLGLAQDAARMLAAESTKAAELTRTAVGRVRDRSRSIAARLRRVNRSIASRTGHSKPLALRLTGEAGELVARSLGEARRLAASLRAGARGRGARTKLRAADRIEQVAERADKVRAQIKRRVAGQTINDRLVSMTDPDARPIRKGKLRHPTEFGTVVQVAELCENTRRGARGLILPLATEIGNRNENTLLAHTGQRLHELDLRPREVALDGGFAPGPVAEHLPPPDRLFIAGRHSAGSAKTNRRLAKFRVGAEGRISHLKRRYGLRRSRLKGHHGTRTWTAWAILAYNLETLAIRTS